MALKSEAGISPAATDALDKMRQGDSKYCLHINNNWLAGSWEDTGLILDLHPPNERRCYKVTPSLVCWAQTWIQPWDIEKSC